MKGLQKQRLSLLLCIVMIFTMQLGVVTYAEEGAMATTVEVNYIGEDGKEYTVDATPIKDGKTITLNTGWYVVDTEDDEVTITEGIIVDGDVKLILADDKKLKVTTVITKAGVRVSEGNILSIYGQGAATGELNAYGGNSGAGIGGGYDGNGGKVNIYGGMVSANGGMSGAGIGGGPNGNGGEVNIYGGTVSAYGSGSGTGIGGGTMGNGGKVNIYGGTVRAYGGNSGAGIGGGYNGNGGKVNIYGGMVSANGGTNGAGIGGGNSGNGGEVNISGGMVDANGGNYNSSGKVIYIADIGAGADGASGGTCIITGGSVKASNTMTGTTTFTDSDPSSSSLLLTTVQLEDVHDMTPIQLLQVINGREEKKYGIKDMTTDAEGKLYLWLPSGTKITRVQTSEGNYIGSIEAGQSDSFCKDTLPPTVIAITPDGNKGSVPVSGDIEVTFSEPMNTTPGMISLDGGNNFLSGGSWSPNHLFYTVSYSGLSYNTKYILQISDFKDTSNYTMKEPYTSSFTTEEEPLLPGVSSNTLTIKKGSTASFMIHLGQGATAVDSASILVENDSIASVNTTQVTTPSAITVTGLAPGTTNITVSFNSGAAKIVAVTVVPVAPSWPKGSALTASNISSTTALLTWTAAQDSTGITGYELYQNGVKIASVQGNAYSQEVTGLMASSNYTFQVQAVNEDGVWTKDGPTTAIKTTPSPSGGNPSSGSSGGSSGGSTSTPTYGVNFSKIEHGSVNLLKETVAAGEIVKFTLKADEGYEIDTLAVKDANGNSIALTQNEDGTYSFKMPSSKVTLEVTFKTAVEKPKPTTPPEETKWDNPFTDVSETSWYYEAAKFVNENKLFAGTDATTFSPNVVMTREMLWTVLGRLDGEDLSGKEVFKNARTWAMSKGVSDGSNPQGQITREQLVTMLWKYLGAPKAQNSDLSQFSDSDRIADYAKEAMAWAIENGIISGVGNAKLAPKEGATRAQVAVFFMNYSKLIEK